MLKIENVKISDITPYKHNAKTHPAEQVEQIAASIRQFGMNDPVAIDEENVIIEGHGRLLAIQKMQAAGEYTEETVPCIRLTHLTDQQKKAYILAHNKLTMNSGFDLDILSDELERITDFDMADFGFIDEEDEEEQEPHEDNYVGAIPAIPKARRGDVYRLGQHRLMCGDSTDPADVATLMDGEKADLFLTDPPYGVAIGDKNHELNALPEGKKGGRVEKNIIGDASDFSCDLLIGAFKNAFDAARDICAYYVTCPPGPVFHDFESAIISAGWGLRHTLIWVKNYASFSLGRLDYDYQHEPVLYGWKKTHTFYARDTQTTALMQEAPDIDGMTEEQAKRFIKKCILDPERITSIIREKKPRKADLHPTMKPVLLFARFIQNSTRAGDIVLDLFGGSGTTMIAAEQLGRRAYLMEIDPHYIDVIIDRWEKATGQTAEKLVEGGE